MQARMNVKKGKEGNGAGSTGQDALVSPALGADDLTALSTVMAAIGESELGRANRARLHLRVGHPHLEEDV